MIEFSGNTVFLLGGGPSLFDSLGELEDDLDKIKRNGWKIIAINDAIYAALYADLLFFRDVSWYFANRAVVDAWIGYIVSSTPSRFYKSKIDVVKTKHCNDFLTGDETIRYGRSSGHLALSLAIGLGAKRCVLLGYDCRLVDGKSNFDVTISGRSSILASTSRNTALTYSHDFLPAWRGWGEAARRAGVEVYNATPDSAILEFPYRSIGEILAG